MPELRPEPNRRFGVIPEAAFGRVGPADWGDRIAVLVGTGPSLSRYPAGVIRSLAAAYGARVIAVKEAVWELPEADACVCVDGKWALRRDLETIPAGTRLYMGEHEPWQGPIPRNAVFLRQQTTGWLSSDPARIVFGATSGFAALNVATLYGARRIILLGYDYGHGEEQHHARPEMNPWYSRGNARLWTYWRQVFVEAGPALEGLGCTVLNVSPLSALTAFPKGDDLHGAFAYLHRLGPSGGSRLPGGGA